MPKFILKAKMGYIVRCIPLKYLWFYVTAPFETLLSENSINCSSYKPRVIFFVTVSKINYCPIYLRKLKSSMVDIAMFFIKKLHRASMETNKHNSFLFVRTGIWRWELKTHENPLKVLWSNKGLGCKIYLSPLLFIHIFLFKRSLPNLTSSKFQP